MNRLQDADAVRQVAAVFLQRGLQGGGRQFILIVVIGRARAVRAEVFMKAPDAGVFLPHFKPGGIKAQPERVVIDHERRFDAAAGRQARQQQPRSPAKGCAARVIQAHRTQRRAVLPIGNDEIRLSLAACIAAQPVHLRLHLRRHGGEMAGAHGVAAQGMDEGGVSLAGVAQKQRAALHAARFANDGRCGHGAFSGSRQATRSSSTRNSPWPSSGSSRNSGSSPSGLSITNSIRAARSRLAA